jgi:hypothetical protein
MGAGLNLAPARVTMLGTLARVSAAGRPRWRLTSTGAANHRPLPDEGHDPRGDRRLHPAPPRAGRAHRRPFHRRRDHQIHQAARGKPRTVNNICTAALIATAGAGKNLVDHASARAAIAEVTATD